MFIRHAVLFSTILLLIGIAGLLVLSPAKAQVAEVELVAEDIVFRSVSARYEKILRDRDKALRNFRENASVRETGYQEDIAILDRRLSASYNKIELLEAQVVSAQQTRRANRGSGSRAARS